MPLDYVKKKIKKKIKEHLYPVTNQLEQDTLPKARRQRNFRITVKKYMIVTDGLS